MSLPAAFAFHPPLSRFSFDMDALHTSQIKAGKIKKTAGKNLQFYYDLFFQVRTGIFQVAGHFSSVIVK